MEYALLVMLLVVCASKSAEPAVDSGHQKAQPGESSPSESAFGRALRVAFTDFQSDRATVRLSGAPISSGSTDQPAQSEATESSDDPKNLDKLPQVANNGGPGHVPRHASLNEDGVTEPSDAILQAHDTLSVVHIFAHREPIPLSHASASEVFGDPTEKNLSPKQHLRLPAFGPFPPNYASEAHGPPFARPDVTQFFCDFEEHQCGMRNQKNIPGHFNRHYLVVHAKPVRYNVSRIITPYLPGYPRAKACLSFSYVIHGGGASRIEVIAQDTVNHHLFRLKQDGPEWRNIQYTMNVRQDVRFFIEAYTTGHAEGVIAIDNFGFNLAPCPTYNVGNGIIIVINGAACHWTDHKRVRTSPDLGSRGQGGRCNMGIQLTTRILSVRTGLLNQRKLAGLLARAYGDVGTGPPPRVPVHSTVGRAYRNPPNHEYGEERTLL